jgi:hypothetical protein
MGAVAVSAAERAATMKGAITHLVRPSAPGASGCHGAISGEMAVFQTARANGCTLIDGAFHLTLHKINCALHPDLVAFGLVWETEDV